MIRPASALLVLLLAAAVAVPANAQQVLSAPPPPQTALDKELSGEKDIATLQARLADYRRNGETASEAAVLKRLVELRPHLGAYKYELAATYGRLDEKSLAYNALLELQTQGYAFDVGKDPRFAPVTTTEVWQYIVEAMDANRQPFGEGEVVYTLPAEDLLLESLAWDPTRKQLLVGSAREGKVLLIDDKGRLKPLVTADDDNGLWAVFDLAVDAERGVLWVASTAVPHFKGYDAEQDLGRAGVFKFDLKTGKFLKRFLSPDGAGGAFFMSSLALGPDGRVYAADGVNNAAYVIENDQLRRLFHAPILGSIRGLAVSGDGKTLYFADHERGLFGYDLVAGKPFEVLVPAKLALGSIDGLFWSKNRLIVVQGAMQPKRVMRLELSPDGRTITGVQPLLANQPAMTFPTQGTLAGNELYLIANSQKLSYDRFGLPRDRSKLEGTRIYRLDIESATAPVPVPPSLKRPD